MNRLWYGLLDLLLPRRCLECNAVVPSRQRPVPLCERDWQSVEPVGSTVCRYCARPVGSRPEGDSPDTVTYPRRPICGHCRNDTLVLECLLAGYRFVSPLRAVVSDWKFDGNPEWGRWLAARLADRVQSAFTPTGWDLLVPVPMYYRRREERGFNQALQLADGLSEAWGIPCRRVLEKHRRTDPQSSLGRDERLKNLEDAFSVRSDVTPPTGKRVLLVDDIYTTGSTLRTATAVLETAGAEAVAGVVLARTPPE